MFSVRALSVGMVCCVLLLTGCPDQDSPPKPQSPPPTQQSAAPSPTPRNLTEGQVQDQINSQMSMLQDRINWMRCTPGPSPTPTLGTGTPIPALNGNQNQTDNYHVWLQYVSRHIGSGTAFGSDYQATAVNALNGFSSLSPTSDTCMAAQTKDTDLQRAWLQTTPEKVGRGLFDTFSPYDQVTRTLAAQDLVKQ